MSYSPERIIPSLLACDYYACRNHLIGITPDKAISLGWEKIGNNYFCPLCSGNKDLKPTKFKRKRATCFMCGKKVNKVLDLVHAKKDICSFECEQEYWSGLCD